MQAPFDLCYGYRGRDKGVHLLSPFEMKRYWRLVEVRPPSERKACGGVADLTEEGAALWRRCRDTRQTFRPQCNVHYTILEGAPRSVFTPDGISHRATCSQNKIRFAPEPGTHYVVLEDEALRIALPDATEVQ